MVGSGIKCISHLTTEAKSYIEQSDIVLYLVNDPIMKEWIQKNNPHAESLDKLYTQHPLRRYCYRLITDYILESLRKNRHVCVVMYGHPAVFAQPALDAVIQAKQEGYDAKILPGVSAEDCLFADLLIDPGTTGCQSYEATDFLIYKRKYDPSSCLILWQVGFIGVLDHTSSHDNRQGIKVLLDYLKDNYPAEHNVTLYEAAQYPGFEPRIDTLSLSKLPDAQFSRLSTLYIPPSRKAICDKEMVNVLKMNISK